MTDQMAESTVAFVEVPGHNVMMLHSDQRTCVGAVVENCPEQTSDRNVGETRSKNQLSEPEQN